MAGPHSSPCRPGGQLAQGRSAGGRKYKPWHQAYRMAGQALRSAATYLQVKSFVWLILRCHAHFFGALANFRMQIAARTARWTERKSHFKSIPLDRLKADRTFVSGLLLEERRSRPDQERLIQRAESLSRDSSHGPGNSYHPSGIAPGNGVLPKSSAACYIRGSICVYLVCPELAILWPAPIHGDHAA